MVPTHLKNISQIGNLPQVGAKIKNTCNHRPVIVFQFQCRHDIQTKSKLAPNRWAQVTPHASRDPPPEDSTALRLENLQQNHGVFDLSSVKKTFMPFHCTDGFIYIYGCFLKWWYPTTMGFPTKNDHFGVFWRYPYVRKHSYMFVSGSLYWLIKISYHWVVKTNQGLEHCWLCQSYPLQNARWFAPIRLAVKTATTILPRKLTHPLKHWWLENKPFLLE